ncbi:hypothetical protein CHS0354_023865 [Potamilus streckersoni]|uniref:DUF885 domain-containing protein n=1 Tax=Potamilus streckersoni TaxID=2493646 RepID=A0AAE0RZ88_9BIVA|nr:hypothetical protein CHS0354_023865 [Potamilus streckersoni]
MPNPISDKYLKEIETFFSKTLGKLKQFNKLKLTKNERTSYDILEWECEINLESLKYNKDLLPLDQFVGFHLTVGQLASGESAQPFLTAKHYDDWLKRLGGFVDFCSTAVEKMKKGIKENIVLPKALTLKIIPQIENLTNDSLDKSIFFSPIKLIRDNNKISNADKERIILAYKNYIRNKLNPALRYLLHFIKNKYLPASRETSGYSSLPNGTAWYEHEIKTYTTLDIKAEAIFQLGKSEVSRIRNEMESVKNQVGFTGTLLEFFNYVRNNKELMPFKKPEEVIENFNQIHKRMIPYLNKTFDLVPKSKFEVRRTEAFREASASAEYIPPSLDRKRPAVFYVPIPNVEKYNYFSDEDLFLHEAIPGHHYQISLQQENKTLPEFRKTLWYSAYGEGWALYAESLGHELGLYKDPFQYFGMLSAEMHRAIRLVVDVGIHALNWTRKDAINYSLENEAESEEGIIAEIERYMAIPGQALSYKIGQLKILELRSKAETELEFHNQLLKHGCLPLRILENKIISWIEDTKRKR